MFNFWQHGELLTLFSQYCQKTTTGALWERKSPMSCKAEALVQNDMLLTERQHSAERVNAPGKDLFYTCIRWVGVVRRKRIRSVQKGGIHDVAKCWKLRKETPWGGQRPQMHAFPTIWDIPENLLLNSTAPNNIPSWGTSTVALNQLVGHWYSTCCRAAFFDNAWSQMSPREVWKAMHKSRWPAGD